MEELLIADFRPVVDVLVDAAEAELDAYVVVSVQRFSQLARDLVAVVNRRRLDLEADRDHRRQSEARKFRSIGRAKSSWSSASGVAPVLLMR